MNVAPECDKVLLVQAELDGELDAAEAAALAAHKAACPVCQAAAAELTRARALVAAEPLYEVAPDDLRRRLVAQTTTVRSGSGEPSRSAPVFLGWWRWVASFGLGAACAATVAFLVAVPGGTSLTDQVVASHLRALQPGHLEDVASSDRHTVKPWFDGRIDFAPPVKDLVADRFPLKGGRLDYLAGRPVVALIYQRDRHIIDLFIMPAEAAAAPPEIAQRQGYNVMHWSADGMALWAVSDIETAQLREFAEAFRRSP